MPFREIVDGDPDRAVVLFDGFLRPVFANGVAKDPVYDLDGPVMATVRGALVSMRNRAERGDGTPAPEFTVQAPGGRPLRATVSPLRREDGRWFVVRLSPPGIVTDPTVKRLQARFHLTQREAEVALNVGKGLSNGETARALGINEKTVKNALVSVYAKCGVRNRVELALRMHDAPLAVRG